MQVRVFPAAQTQFSLMGLGFVHQHVAMPLVREQEPFPGGRTKTPTSVPPDPSDGGPDTATADNRLERPG
jgi:hypothetical protein